MAATLFALALDPPVRADATATVTALSALLLLSPVRADATTATLFALALDSPVFALRSLPAASVACGKRAALP